MSATLFLVQRCAVAYGGAEPRERTDRPAFEPWVPLRLFSERAAAEACRDELRRRLRRAIDPFEMAHYPDGNLTSMTDKEFVNCLWGLGVTPPVRGPGGRRDPLDWRAWWRETLPTLSGEQFDAIWDLFDRLKLVEVVELPLDRG